MLKLFSSKNPLIILLYPIIAFILIRFNSDNINFSSLFLNKPFFYQHFISLFNGTYFKEIYISLSVVLLSVDSVLFNRLIRQLKLVKLFQNLHGLIFLLLIGFCLKFIDYLQVSLALFFFIATISVIIKSLRKNLAVFDFFSAGLFLSIASFFWFQVLYFYPIILFGLLIFRSLNLREITTSLIGIFIPYLFLFSIYFFIFSDFAIIYDIYQLIFFKNIEFYLNFNQIASGIFLLIILLISVVSIINRYRNTESDIKDYYIFFFIIFLLSLTLLILLRNNNLNFIVVLIMTATVPIGIFFSKKSHPIFKEILFDLLLLAVIFSETIFFI